MVTKRQLGCRISALHFAMLDELCDTWGMNQGELVQNLIGNAWRKHRRALGLNEDYDAALLRRLIEPDDKGGRERWRLISGR